MSSRRHFLGIMGASTGAALLASAIPLEQRSDGRVITTEPQRKIIVPVQHSGEYISIPVGQIIELQQRVRGVNPIRTTTLDSAGFEEFALNRHAPIELHLTVICTDDLLRNVQVAVHKHFSSAVRS